MNPYLAKLRARDHKTHHPQEPSKPSKRILPVVALGDTTAEMSFEGFEGDQSRCFSGNEGATKAVEHTPLGRLCRTLEHLESRCPDLVANDRWQQAVQDGRRFLAQWDGQAEALGWTARDLFGLAPIPDKPRPSYRRLSRYDETGLIWLLDGRKVLALTAETAAIHNPSGSITTYRRHHKTCSWSSGDCLDDLTA
jgi:hypothetical protein